MNIIDKFSLVGKNAFVFGGSGTIGKNIVNNFLELKVKVHSLDLNPANDNLTENSNLFNFIEYDVTKFSSMKSSIQNLVSKYGVPDIFINASYPRSSSWLNSSRENMKPESFRENIDLHLNSYCISSKLIADEMVTNKKNGSIILLGSIYGHIGQDPNLYDETNLEENKIYPIIKGGISSHVRQMAAIYGKYGIRVNAISPGGFQVR